jgi:hypothetical protein
MKPMKISILALAVLLNSRLALAQHGHGMGLSHSSSHATSSAKGGQQSLTQKLTENTKLADRISKLTGVSATLLARASRISVSASLLPTWPRISISPADLRP